MGQRRGYLGIKEVQDAGAEEKRLQASKLSKKKKNSGVIKSKKAKCEDSKRSIKSDIAAFEKKHKDEPKGTSFFWKSTIEIVQGLVVNLYLTCIVDSKFC